MPATIETDLPQDVPRQIENNRSGADRRFRGLTLGSGLAVLALMALIGFFLLWRSRDAFSYMGVWGFLTTQEWRTNGPNPSFGVATLLYGTFVIAGIALLIAVPLSIATALFINEYAPRSLQRGMIGLVDLLAAIPSVIYGLWGVGFFQNQLLGTSKWLSNTLGFIPIFEVRGESYSSSNFIAGVVVSIMILPIATSVIREVFSQTPPGEKEGALALGSTRWGMVRTVILPFGRGGIIGGSMLAFGRAIGETIAVAIIISPTFSINSRILEPKGNSVASNIALKFGEDFGSKLGSSALLASGFVLFCTTLVVNIIASYVVSRSRSGQGVDA